MDPGLLIRDYGSGIMDPDYGSGITDPGLRTRVCGSGSGLQYTDWNSFGHDRLKMNQQLPYFYKYNYSRYLIVAVRSKP